MAQWKKLIVSGSDAELNSLLVDDFINVGGNQIISSSAADTILSGSFSGSFFGNITADLGIEGTDGSTGVVDLESENLVFATGSTDAMDITVSNDTVTFTLNDATTTTKGISSFSNSYFNVSSGAVSISASAITETELNTSVAGTGLSGGGGSPLSVDYGSTAGTAVEGDTSLTVQGTTNEIEVTGGTITLGAGGTVTVGLPNDVTITNDLSVGNDVTITGNLTVNGTTTTIDTTNLVVEDKFILLASGSTSATDGGIVIQAASDGTGRALFYDSTETRWSLRNSLSGTATTGTPEANIAAVVDVAGASHSDTATYQKNGNIKIEGTDIYIWAP